MYTKMLYSIRMTNKQKNLIHSANSWALCKPKCNRKHWVCNNKKRNFSNWDLWQFLFLYTGWTVNQVYRFYIRRNLMKSWWTNSEFILNNKSVVACNHMFVCLDGHIMAPDEHYVVDFFGNAHGYYGENLLVFWLGPALEQLAPSFREGLTWLCHIGSLSYIHCPIHMLTPIGLNL